MHLCRWFTKNCAAKPRVIWKRSAAITLFKRRRWLTRLIWNWLISAKSSGKIAPIFLQLRHKRWGGFWLITRERDIGKNAGARRKICRLTKLWLLFRPKKRWFGGSGRCFKPARKIRRETGADRRIALFQRFEHWRNRRNFGCFKCYGEARLGFGKILAATAIEKQVMIICF